MHRGAVVLLLVQLAGLTSSSIIPLDIELRAEEHHQFQSVAVDKRLQDAGERRVPMYSGRQCKLSAGEKEDCGRVGIQKGECLKRGCCWKATNEESVPWCYHSKPTLTSRCTSVHDDERMACGSYGIQIKECLAQKCCWRPTDTAGAPWCYHRRGLINPDTCGVPVILPNVNLRIVGGVDAVPNSWPWMVSLQFEGRHMCGATLISEEWILTAAHCNPQLYGMQGIMRAVLGIYNVQTMEPEEYTIAIDWDQAFPHPEYGSLNGYDHDHMVVRLEHPVEFNDAIRPVCLAKTNQTAQPGKHTCYATGWGRTTMGGIIADKLQQVKIPIVQDNVCNDWYSAINMAIDDSMICAGYEEGGRNTCQGDSGGPLICYENERWVQHGITSWAMGCALESFPTVFARVSYGYEWITETVTENSSDDE